MWMWMWRRGVVSIAIGDVGFLVLVLGLGGARTGGREDG